MVVIDEACQLLVDFPKVFRLAGFCSVDSVAMSVVNRAKVVVGRAG